MPKIDKKCQCIAEQNEFAENKINSQKECLQLVETLDKCNTCKYWTENGTLELPGNTNTFKRSLSLPTPPWPANLKHQYVIIINKSKLLISP